MIDLGQVNAAAMATDIFEPHHRRIPGWPEAARNAGLDPESLTAVWSHFEGGSVPKKAVASFFVNSRRDPRWYLVPRD